MDQWIYKNACQKNQSFQLLFRDKGLFNPIPWWHGFCEFIRPNMYKPKLKVFHSRRGFTLVEIVIVLAVITVLLGVLVPLGFQFLMAGRSSAVQTELQALYNAIIGDPKRGVFGYVGDVGSYPKGLMDLIVQPTDGSGNPLPGWKGPYIEKRLIENGVLIDSFGNPFEFYLTSGSDVPDQLALISRGQNKVSTNTADNPNLALNFSGLSPDVSGYMSDAGNADNAVFPSVDGNPNAVNVVTAGDLALNILNYDNNPKVNTFVPACPELFQVKATSVTRGAVEADVRYVQALAFNLTQGQYGVSIAPQGMATTSWSETVTVQPGATLTRTLNLTGLDSSGTPLFNLTVINGFTVTELEVFEFDQRLTSTDNKNFVDNGETKTFTPHGCAQIYVKEKNKSTILDQFVMPYGAFKRREGALAATLTVKNTHGHPHHDHGNGHLHHHEADGFEHHQGHHRIFVYRNDILLGTVNHHQTKTFKDLSAGDAITIKDRDGALLGSLTLAVGNNSVTVT